MKYADDLDDWIKNLKVGDQVISCMGKVQTVVRIEDEIGYGMPLWMAHYFPEWPEWVYDKWPNSWATKSWFWLFYKVNDLFDKDGLWPLGEIHDRTAFFADGYQCGLVNCGEEATPENIAQNEIDNAKWEEDKKNGTGYFATEMGQADLKREDEIL